MVSGGEAHEGGGEITAPIASSAIEHPFDCLGWIYSSVPAKSRPFEEECEVLSAHQCKQSIQRVLEACQ